MALKTIILNYTGIMQTWIPPEGVYRIKIECYGAKGGGSMMNGSVNSNGAKGGYCCGEYTFERNTQRKLYIYVGGAGIDGRFSNTPGGWNGGGIGTYDGRDDEGGGSGGGASDVRLVAASSGSWYDTSHTSWDTDKSLLSRIIVAGGGGGLSWNFTAGEGGGLTGGRGANNTSTSATQTSGYAFGRGQDAWSVVWDGNGGNIGQGGGGGGWYGGYTSAVYPNVSGCGGSSYYGNLINAKTIAGLNNDKGKVTITYEEGYFFLEHDGKYYITTEKYFDTTSNSFIPVSISDIYNNIVNGAVYPLINLYKPFMIDGVYYYPNDIFDYSNSKIGIIDINKDYKLDINYIPSNIALSKTNIKVKNKYTPVHDELEPTFLDINSNNKAKIDYFLDFGKNEAYKNCSVLDDDIIINDFYLNLKFNSYDGIFNSMTLYGKNNDKYTKLKSTNINVYDNFNFEMLICFKDNYEEVLVNKIAKQSIDYTIDTLDKF
jgi:hypothetical protein